MSRSKLGQYIYNLALGADQMLNAILLGDPDESISGRMGRAIKSGRPKWWVPLCARANDWFFRFAFGEENHNLNSIEPEERPYEKEIWSWQK